MASAETGAGGGAPTPATATSAEAPCCTTRTWFGKCAVAFQKLKLHSGATGAALDLQAVCAASRLMAESYGFMFGAKGMVTGVLLKDVEDNTGGLERAAGRLSGSAPPGALSEPMQVEELLALELTLRSLDDVRRNRKESALTCALWMSRALLFVSRFGSRLIQRPGASPTEVAKEVYTEVLRPYHGFLLASIVSLAFSMAPTRVDFFHRIGGCAEEEIAAAGELEAFVRHVLPCAEALHAWFVAKGYNFPDAA